LLLVGHLLLLRRRIIRLLPLRRRIVLALRLLRWGVVALLRRWIWRRSLSILLLRGRIALLLVVLILAGVSRHADGRVGYVEGEVWAGKELSKAEVGLGVRMDGEVLE